MCYLSPIILNKYDQHIYRNTIQIEKKQVILLMITDNKKWHYLFVKRLPALLKGITSKHV